jgi:hypothetical protein
MLNEAWTMDMCSEPDCERPYAHKQWHWGKTVWWTWVREFDNRHVRVVKNTAVEAWDYQQGTGKPKFD